MPSNIFLVSLKLYRYTANISTVAKSNPLVTQFNTRKWTELFIERGSFTCLYSSKNKLQSVRQKSRSSDFFLCF